MDGNASHNNPMFNPYLQTENQGGAMRGGNSQLGMNSQSPAPGLGDGHENVRLSQPGFSSPSSVNTSTQSVNGSATPQMQSKDVSFSLLQALLKPQPSNYSGPGSDQFFSQQSDISSPAAMQGGAGAGAMEMAKQSPMEQLKRMVAIQNTGIPAQQHQQQQQQQHIYQTSAMVPGQQSNPLSAYSSPRLDTESDNVRSMADTPVAAFATSANVDDIPSAGVQAKNGNSSNGNGKKKKPTSMNIDARKIKLRAKPEILPISLLPQPARFRPGRLIAVSREYICYAVRSKEGGRIRVIHQMLGKLAKMQGHTDSIIDMAFHPCSREDGMPQILASLGKDNRLIVWLVGPVDLEADSPEGAIAHEPFLNVDSGGDSRFTCLAWSSVVDADTMELCVGTDKGFMVVKAPVPISRGKRPDIPNNGMQIMPVSTDSAVTAIERAGAQWVITATADNHVRVFELDASWETSSQPYKVACEITKCDHPVETLIYVAPASAADGAGHVIIGSQMNKSVQLWWLGNNASRVEHLQTINFVGAPAKPAPAFVKLSWAEQGRCLTAGASYASSGIFVFKTHGHGTNMAFGFPHGYPLGNDQLTLSLFSAVEPAATGDSPGSTVLSVYGVHTRQIQQLQIAGIRAVDYETLPDPASVYAANATVDGLHVAGEQPRHVPAAVNQVSNVDGSREATNSAVHALPAAPAPAPASSQELSSALSSQLMSQIASVMEDVKLSVSSRQPSAPGSVSLDPQSEAKIVERISEAVEMRVTQSMATVMEQTIIPAYNRATAAMFEQMQSTFEAGLREWWTRFAQMMPPPPPPPHIATPISHMVMMPQQQQQQQQQQVSTQSGSLTNVAVTSVETPMPIDLQQQQQHQQQQHQQHMPMSMPIPRPMSNVSYPGPMAGHMPNMFPSSAAPGGVVVSSPNVNHIESLRNILNLPPAAPNKAPPPQQQ
ncbi:hypothetical protein H4S06_002060 [Coemansia sp. BCRC 34490]|nr:hypothetical protein H4S06_002060 [Coemansia sp. BCRC 34490]